MTQDLKYLKLLSEKYPNRQSVCTEIINLAAIMNLPKGTEHFMSDIHGEYEAFLHIMNNCSGVIREKVQQWLGSRLGWLFLSTISLGLAMPWVHTRLLRFDTVHTRVGGSPLVFRGKGLRLLGECLRLVLLSVITLGLYGFFWPVRYRRWRLGNTVSLSATEYYVCRSRAYEQTVGPDAARIRRAHTESQLERVKSGVTGEEDEAALRALAEEGNRSALYELAVLLKGESESFTGEAREKLKESAILGYAPAMAAYAGVLTPKEGPMYARLLEDSAFQGCLTAPWLLKEYYESIARNRRAAGDYDSAQQLQKAAYWYAVALELNDGDALRAKNGYEPIVWTIAQWMTEEEEPPRPSRWPLVLFVALVIAAGLGAGYWWYSQQEPQAEPEVSVLELWRGETILESGGELFRNGPWKPGVVTCENMEIRNTGDTVLRFTLTLTAEQGSDLIGCAMLQRKVSVGDLETVMRQGTAFLPMQVFSITRSLAPGESFQFALIAHWEGGEDTPVPEGITLPMQTDIRVTITEIP